MGYTRNEILSSCNKAFREISTFYKQPFVNYRGRTTDTKELYTEVVAEFSIKSTMKNALISKS